MSKGCPGRDSLIVIDAEIRVADQVGVGASLKQLEGERMVSWRTEGEQIPVRRHICTQVCTDVRTYVRDWVHTCAIPRR